MRTVHVFLLFKAAQIKLYDDIFALIVLFDIVCLACDYCACPHYDIDAETIYCAALIPKIKPYNSKEVKS